MFRPFAFLFFLLLSSPAISAEKIILVFGDSLSAGFGLAVHQSWPALLDQYLKQSGSQYAVANASISGETTAGGKARFAAALTQFKPAVVIIALGANDGLRGLPIAAMRENLSVMATAAKKNNARVLLVGMRLPPNYGAKYTQEFEQAFIDIAKRERLALLPFLLEPFAAERNAFQADALHPTAVAQPRILHHVLTQLKPLLK
jgi:acyl-CoA thioesterase-1